MSFLGAFLLQSMNVEESFVCLSNLLGLRYFPDFLSVSNFYACACVLKLCELFVRVHTCACMRMRVRALSVCSCFCLSTFGQQHSCAYVLCTCLPACLPACLRNDDAAHSTIS